MITRHFLKTLITFLTMIILGLLGVFAVNSLSQESLGTTNSNNQVPVAE